MRNLKHEFSFNELLSALTAAGLTTVDEVEFIEFAHLRAVFPKFKRMSDKGANLKWVKYNC